ncbi:MAG: endonuclease [Bacteroidota bacterium]
MKYCLSFFLGCLFTTLSAQSLIPNPSVLNFGDKFETQIDSLSLSLDNPLPYPVNITEIRFYNTYTAKDFWVNSSSFSVPANGQISFWVYFSPRHNINYNSEMLILTDSKRGAISVNLRGVGKYSNPYYNSLANNEEQALKTAIKTLVGQNYVQLSYNAGRDEMFMVIDNQRVNGQGASVNTLEGVYTGQLVTGYTNRSAAQNMGFNTEHVFPQGFFNSNLPMRSDIHHLFPTNSNANSERGNLPFGLVSNPTWQQGGSKKGNGKFEPRDEHKGEIARAMMYFVLRYQDYSNHFSSQTAILKQWNVDFPPDDVARRRNDDVEAAQGNRNPFVDYPQLAERITNFSANSVAAANWQLDREAGVIAFDTVGFPTQAYYQYPLVNHGNQDIQLNQLSFKQGFFSFKDNSGTPATISPGEAITILIRPDNGFGLVNDTLQISTNIPGTEQINVPISAFFDTANPIESTVSSPFKVFPIPSRGTLFLEGGNPLQITHYQIIDLQGKVISKGEWQGEKHQLSTSALPDGVYILTLQEGEASWSQKVHIR